MKEASTEDATVEVNSGVTLKSMNRLFNTAIADTLACSIVVLLNSEIETTRLPSSKCARHTQTLTVDVVGVVAFSSVSQL